MVDTLVELQEEVKRWTEHNFPDTTSDQAMLGVVEEVGELAHAILKSQQNIRMNEDHEAHIKDSIGDIVIFLAHYCIKKGYDLDSIVNLTWAHVSRRDWKKFPTNGVSA